MIILYKYMTYGQFYRNVRLFTCGADSTSDLDFRMY